MKARGTRWLFVLEDGRPISADLVEGIVIESAEVAGIGVHGHPYMLRHSAGYTLAGAPSGVR